jgi:hypothetical protein
MLQPLHERRETGLSFRIVPGKGYERADAPHPFALLGTRQDRPRSRAGKHSNELPPSHRRPRADNLSPRAVAYPDGLSGARAGVRWVLARA